jgi:hypothetical protein
MSDGASRKGDETTAGGPYRSVTNEPRFVCIVCYRIATTVPATCPLCDAPLLPLDSRDVAQSVRERVSSRLARKRAWLSATGFVVSFPVSAALCRALHLPLLARGWHLRGSNLIGIAMVVCFLWIATTAACFRAPRDNEPMASLLARLRVDRR